MNEISFRRHAYTLVFKRNLPNRWKPRPRQVEVDLVVPIIDGRTVAEIVGWRGALPGLAFHYVEPAAEQWNGPPAYGEDGKTAIIDGDCGVAGCCGVQADVVFDSDTVRWTRFMIGTREADQREFVFDRTEYSAAVNGIASLQATPVRRKI